MLDADRIAATVVRIGPPFADAAAAALVRQRTLTKPDGSLGRLEDLAVQIAGITGTSQPRIDRAAVIVMAADHGLVAESVSAYPKEVTGQMVANFLAGGAAINVLARVAGVEVIVVDIGVAGELANHPELRARRVAPGTANLRLAPAMSHDQARRALVVGIDVLECEAKRGLSLVAVGDMGIGNTTAASAIVASLCEASPRDVTGRGTGIDDRTLERKATVIAEALERHRPDPRDPVDVLAKVGGLEIAGIAGVILAAAAARIPIVLDGFITGAAALVAATIAPRVQPFLIAGHRSVEPGHRIVLERLGLRPLLDLELRLGEGTGATLAIPLIRAALRAHSEMATFAEAGVASRQRV